MLEHALYLYYVFHITRNARLCSTHSLAHTHTTLGLSFSPNAKMKTMVPNSRYTLYLLLMCTKMVVFLCFIQFGMADTRNRSQSSTSGSLPFLKPPRARKFICISFRLSVGCVCIYICESGFFLFFSLSHSLHLTVF